MKERERDRGIKGGREKGELGNCFQCVFHRGLK